MLLDEYKEKKVKILRELKIKVSKGERCHLYNLQTEISIDNYARKLIMEGLSDEPKQNKYCTAKNQRIALKSAGRI